MAKDIYKKLAEHLDELPGGFPPTESGVELKILRKLFTPEEAEIAVHTTLIPEEAKIIAKRAGWPEEEAASVLDRMGRTGLLLFVERPGHPTLFMAAQYVIGIWEYHVNTLDRELVDYMEEYVPTLMDPRAWKKAPQLRTIPVGKSLTPKQAAMPYEEAAVLIDMQKKILVAPCICRREHKIAGRGCDRPEETCLIFGSATDYYLKNKIGRLIEKEEAHRILEEADRAGLVLQPSNSQKILNICLCCGCCCQILLGLKRMPVPAEYISSSYVAVLDEEKCVGCERCVTRCQMEALRMEGDKAVLKLSNCIGCGLCVTTCKPGALTLSRKADPPKVHERYSDTMLEHGRARGKLGGVGLAMTAIKSKLDRLKASK